MLLKFSVCLRYFNFQKPWKLTVMDKFSQRLETMYLWIMSILEIHKDRINALCQKHKVSKLFVFGSVLTNDFKESSDVDFLVDFGNIELYDYADNYFQLKSSLENLLQKPIDLLEDIALKNPYLRKSIDASKELIYGS